MTYEAHFLFFLQNVQILMQIAKVQQNVDKKFSLFQVILFD